MTSEKQYEPGTVAVATVRGVPGVRIVRGEGHWAVAADTDDFYTDRDAAVLVTDIRPLVVLDLGGLVDPARLVASLRHSTICGSAAIADAIADQIEAQTKPPRIPEPGLWGVVSSPLMRGKEPWTLVRHDLGWIATDGGIHQWSDLLDPVLIREGVQS